MAKTREQRIAAIRAYATPAAGDSATYADLVWLCDQLELAESCRDEATQMAADYHAEVVGQREALEAGDTDGALT